MKLDSSISAVITGGASGLGAATARLLASHGVKVALFDLNEELGEKTAKEIMTKLNLPMERRVSQLTDAEVLQIREMIDRDFLVEGDLRREVSLNIKRLMDLGCYRGLRHRRGLPVNGQRTHTNARTRKGPRKGMVARRPPPGKK